jgi:hypothetical protein
MTGCPPVNSIGYVFSRMLLTKRRAVDFCRVATAMCPGFASATAWS